MSSLADGFAVGVAFRNNIEVGIKTAVAIGFHELPHELADFSIYLIAGLSYHEATIVNFGCKETKFKI